MNDRFLPWAMEDDSVVGQTVGGHPRAGATTGWPVGVRVVLWIHGARSDDTVSWQRKKPFRMEGAVKTR